MSHGGRWVLYAVIFALGGTFSFISFWLAWGGKARFLVITILPGAYLVSGLWRLLNLSSNSTGAWYALFVVNAVICGVVFVMLTWLVFKISSWVTSRGTRNA